MKRLAGPSTSVTTFYFLVFLSLGSYLPFYTVWLQSIGISERGIGVIAAIPSFLMVLTTVFIGNLADQAKDWRSVIIGCNFTVAALVTFLMLVEGFYPILLVWTAWSVVLMAMTPILDAASIRMSNHRNFSFHRIRAIGSVGFITGVLLIGLLVDQLGIGVFVYLLVAMAWMRAVASLMLPKFRDGLTRNTTVDSSHGGVNALLAPWFLLTLVGAALIQASHAYFYLMGTVIWTDAGYSAQVISWLWILGVIVEVAVMWVFASIAKRYSARRLLLFAAIVSTLRWLIFGFDPSLGWLFVIQCLHGVVFAIVFLASINFIANWTPVEVAARAQSIAAVFNTGLMAVGTLASGFLYDSLHVRGYWVMLLLCLCSFAMVVMSLKLQPAERE